MCAYPTIDATARHCGRNAQQYGANGGKCKTLLKQHCNNNVALNLLHRITMRNLQNAIIDTCNAVPRYG
jgi:hypothetical protein